MRRRRHSEPMNPPASNATVMGARYKVRSQFRLTRRLSPRYPRLMCCMVLVLPDLVLHGCRPIMATARTGFRHFQGAADRAATPLVVIVTLMTAPTISRRYRYRAQRPSGSE